MTDDMSKYGFFIVICMYEDGHKRLCYDYDSSESAWIAEFASEKEAMKFRDYCTEKAKERDYKVSYYHKYVSWSMYD